MRIKGLIFEEYQKHLAVLEACRNAGVKKLPQETAEYFEDDCPQKIEIEKIKLCKGCRFFKLSKCYRNGILEVQLKPRHYCFKQTSIKSCFQNRNNESACGRNARWFKPVEEGWITYVIKEEENNDN